MNDASLRRAAELVETALVWDDHSGFMPDPAADLNNLRIWRDAGVNYLSIDVGFDLMPWTKTVETLAHFRKWLNGRPDEYSLVERAADVAEARAAGRMAITFDIEGMNALNGRVEMVEFYHRLGVRQMLFAYNRNNLAGGGCHDDDCGLTAFGREVIDEMNRLGMFVDLSHAGPRTVRDVLEYSDQPVMFSHSNAKGLRAHGRNVDDGLLRACAERGGVIGAVGIGLFIGEGRAGPEAFADHIDHLITVAGPEHVGLGLDYGFEVELEGLDEIVANHPEFWPLEEGYGSAPMSFVSPDMLPAICGSLLDRGHSEEVIRGVLGENFLALAERIWR
jgi:membrane dipeptidase